MSNLANKLLIKRKEIKRGTLSKKNKKRNLISERFYQDKANLTKIGKMIKKKKPKIKNKWLGKGISLKRKVSLKREVLRIKEMSSKRKSSLVTKDKSKIITERVKDRRRTKALRNQTISKSLRNNENSVIHLFISLINFNFS